MSYKYQYFPVLGVCLGGGGQKIEISPNLTHIVHGRQLELDKGAGKIPVEISEDAVDR